MCLICKEDYHWIIGPSLKKVAIDDPNISAGVYSLLNGSQYPEGRLGYFSYSDPEEKALKEWLGNLTKDQLNLHWKWLNESSNVEQIKVFLKINPI